MGTFRTMRFAIQTATWTRRGAEQWPRMVCGREILVMSSRLSEKRDACASIDGRAPFDRLLLWIYIVGAYSIWNRTSAYNLYIRRDTLNVIEKRKKKKKTKLRLAGIILLSHYYSPCAIIVCYANKAHHIGIPRIVGRRISSNQQIINFIIIRFSFGRREKKNQKTHLL